MRSCDVQQTSKSIASLKMDFITLSKLAESATWSSGRSSVDKMTILLISFDLTSIHELRLRGSTFSMLGFIFLVKKNCVKCVDFGQERAKKSDTKSVGHHRRLIGGSRSSVSSGLIPKGVAYIWPTGYFHYYIKT